MALEINEYIGAEIKQVEDAEAANMKKKAAHKPVKKGMEGDKRKS